MKSRTDSSQKTDDNINIKQLLDDLENAISSLPLGEMIDRITLENGLKSRPALSLSYWADNLIRLLTAQSFFGDTDSVRVLRDIGILVDKALTSLTKVAGEETESDHPGLSYEHPALKLAEGKTTVKLTGDFSPVTDILERHLSDVSSVTPGKIQKILRSKLHPGSQDLINVEVDTALSWGNDPLEFPESSECVHSTHHKNWLRRMRITPDTSKSHTIPEIIPKDPHSALHTGLEGMIVERLLTIANDRARNTVSIVASESLTWPTYTSALEDKQPDRDEYLASLSLGDSLPFRTKSKGKAGTKRSFKTGTQAAFALEYCAKLNAIRMSHLSAAEDKLKELQTRAKIHENKMSEDPALYYEVINGTKGGTNWPMRLDMNGLWVFKAAFLPDFPKKDKSTESKASLQAWLNVAILRAERLCSGDWDNYPWWPTCVKNRAGWDAVSKRHRTVQETVAEKLKMGMIILMKSD